jgi:hypothetical protein
MRRKPARNSKCIGIGGLQVGFLFAFFCARLLAQKKDAKRLSFLFCPEMGLLFNVHHVIRGRFAGCKKAA